jgi:uncharacterized membrane protein YdfJ with MMPL/SSD domain
MKKIPIIIRIILTLALVFAVYTETGIWTAVSLGLIFVGIEYMMIIINRIREEIGLDRSIKDLYSKNIKRRLK